MMAVLIKWLKRFFGILPKTKAYIDDGFSYEFYHTEGKNACGKLAFTCIKHPRINMSSSNVILPNGERPSFCSIVKCGTCGKGLGDKPEEKRIKRIV